MKLNKKVLSIFFVAMFAFVLAACDGIDTTLPTTEEPTTEVTTEAPTTTEGVTTEAPTTQAPTTTEDMTTEAPTTTEEMTTVDLQSVLDTVVAMYADTLDNVEFVATEDLDLIAYYESYYVNWLSSNTDYLSHNGTVTRPLLTEGDQTVILTLTVTDGVSSAEYSFFVTIQALTEKTGQEIANEVFLVATAFPNKSLWSSADELTFVETAEDLDGTVYDVTWASSNEDIIDLDGNIVQPEDEDTDVTITASITVDDVVFSKEIVFTVAKMAEGTEVSTIAEAIAMGQDSYVEILGVTVVAMYGTGDVFFTDGTDILYIYSPPFMAEVGGVYDITGYIDFYYNAPQLAGSDTQPLRIVESDAAASEAPVIADATVNSIVTNTQVPTEENPHEYLTYEVTAAVYFEESWGNYSVFLVPTDYDFDADLPDGATQPNGDAIMVYYRSDMDVLEAFHGQVVTIEIVMQGYRTDKTVFYGNFFGTVLDVDIDIADDTEAVATALDALNYPTPILEDTTLLLPTELYGVTLAWSSTDNAVIDPTTGFVDVASLTTQVTVTLTVDASRGAVTDQKEFEITVGELPVTDIADVLDATEGTFLIEGILISGEYQNTYFIQDDTESIALYTNGTTTIEDILDANLGNVIQVTGTRTAYRGLNQIAVDMVEFVSESTVPAPTNLDALELTAENLEDYQGDLIELTDMIVSTVDVDGFGNITLMLAHLYNGTMIEVKWDSRVSLPTELNSALQSLEVGDALDIVAPLGWYDAPRIFITTDSMITEVVLTDDQKLAADKAALTYGGDVYVAMSETLPLTGINNSTIVWSITADDGSNATLDVGTGAFSIVEPTAVATVELTATLTLGDASDTAVFTYNLMVAPAVDLGDFATQTEGDVVKITGVVYAVISNGVFVEDATGQLFVFSYELDYEVGDEVLLIGEVGEYNGSPQLTDLVYMPTALSTDNAVTMTAEEYVHGTTTLVPGQLYSVTGTVAIEGQYNNVYIYVNETDSFEIYYRSPSESIEVLEGLVDETVTVEIIYYNDMTSFVYVGGTEGVMVEEAWIAYGDFTLVEDGTDKVVTYGVVPAQWWNSNLQTENIVFDGEAWGVAFTFTGEAGQDYLFKFEGGGNDDEIAATATGSEQTVVLDLSGMTVEERAGLNLFVFFAQSEGESGTFTIHGWEALKEEWIAYGDFSLVEDGMDKVVTYGAIPTNWWEYNLQVEDVRFFGTNNAVEFTFTGEAGQDYLFKFEGGGSNDQIGVTATGDEQTVILDLTAMTDEQLDGLNLFVFFAQTVGEQGTFTIHGWEALMLTEVTDFTDLVTMTNGTDYDIANDTMVKITGVVAGNSYDGLFLQDANGVGFFLYKPDESGINIGDEVSYIGTVGDYSDARQITYGAYLLEVLSTGNALVVTPVTADEIDAFGMNDAGTLYSFDGFTYEGLDSFGSLLLGYTLSDGVTTGTVTVRYYDNWSDLEAVHDNYTAGDALPTVEFMLYNFRFGDTQLDVVSVDFTDQQLYDFDVNAIPDPLELTEDLVVEDGDNGTTWDITAASSSLDGYVDYTTTPGTLLVTRPAAGEANVTGTLTVTATNGTATGTVTINVEVIAEVETGSSMVESFDNLGLSGSSYAAGSFVGDNSITWSYTESRGDFDLTGQAIMLDKDGDGSSLSATITGGIGSFSVDFYDAYSGAAQVELWINGTLVATSVAFDDDGDGSVYETFTVENINITGEFDIEILAAGAQMVLDNLTWTPYTAE